MIYVLDLIASMALGLVKFNALFFLLSLAFDFPFRWEAAFLAWLLYTLISVARSYKEAEESYFFDDDMWEEWDF